MKQILEKTMELNVPKASEKPTIDQNSFTMTCICYCWYNLDLTPFGLKGKDLKEKW